MLRNVITGPKVTEIYKVDSDMRRGTVVAKNLSTKKATKAEGNGVDIYLVDFDYVPTGHLSDVEISAYTDQADIIKKDSLAILIKPIAGTQWATDQIDASGLVEGDYLITGTGDKAGKLIKATTGDTTTLKYIGVYNDAGHTLHQFEIINPHTVA